jgi:hypothetical protein
MLGEVIHDQVHELDLIRGRIPLLPETLFGVGFRAYTD